MVGLRVHDHFVFSRPFGRQGVGVEEEEIRSILAQRSSNFVYSAMSHMRDLSIFGPCVIHTYGMVVYTC